MKQLKPTNLIAIEIPDDGEYPILYPYGLMYLHHNGIEEKIELGDSIDCKYRLLGEVTKEGVQFDVESYVVRYKITLFSGVPDVYYDYVHDGFDFKKYIQKYRESINKTFPFETPQESFQSLLQANNVEIPEGKKLLILLKY